MSTHDDIRTPDRAPGRARARWAYIETIPENKMKTLLKALVIIGFALAVLQALRMPMISDTVNPSLYAHDVWKHGSWQYYVPVNDPYVLDYILAVVLSPLAGGVLGVMLPAIAIFAGIIVFSWLVVGKISGPLSGLAAAALVANAPAPALQLLVYPVWHGSTMLLTLITLYVYLSNIESRLKCVLIMFLAGFAVYCDTLALPILVVPLAALCLCKSRPIRNIPDSIIVLAGGVAGYLLKVGGGEIWPGGLRIVTLGGLDKMLTGFYPEGIATYLINLIVKSGGPALLLAIIGMAIIASRRRDARWLTAFAIAASLCMLLGFMTMGYNGGDLGRYLYILPLLFLLPAACLVREKSILALVVPTLILTLALTTAMGIMFSDPDPNAKDYALVDWLLENNVTGGHADYWAANLLRYVSDGQVELAPTIPSGDNLTYLYLNAAERWNQPSNILMVYEPGDPLAAWAREYNLKCPPRQVLVYDKYHSPGTNSGSTMTYVYIYDEPLPLVDNFKNFKDGGVKPV
jgi:hypothetical protein